jgi:hypothetical protein
VILYIQQDWVRHPDEFILKYGYLEWRHLAKRQTGAKRSDVTQCPYRFNDLFLFPRSPYPCPHAHGNQARHTSNRCGRTQRRPVEK